MFPVTSGAAQKRLTMGLAHSVKYWVMRGWILLKWFASSTKAHIAFCGDKARLHSILLCIVREGASEASDICNSKPPPIEQRWGEIPVHFLLWNCRSLQQIFMEEIPTSFSLFCKKNKKQTKETKQQKQSSSFGAHRTLNVKMQCNDFLPHILSSYWLPIQRYFGPLLL